MMGCATQKLSRRKFFNKADLIQLQKYPEELHEKRMKILKWMEGEIDIQIKMNHDYRKINWKKIKEHGQLLHWQEAWEREQELVQHPSMVEACESKMSCITLIDENLRFSCDKDDSVV